MCCPLGVPPVWVRRQRAGPRACLSALTHRGERREVGGGMGERVQVFSGRSLGPLESLTKAGDPLQDSEGLLETAEAWLGSVWAWAWVSRGSLF